MIPRVRFCRSADGVRVAYATMGAGPPVLIAPTWLTHLEFDWDVSVWKSWFEAFAERHTVIRYDLRGCGLSDRTVGESSLRNWVDDLEAVADAMELDRVPLVGICQGGPIAVSYAARHPERVSRLVLYGSYVQGGLVGKRHVVTAEEVRALAVLIENGWGRPLPAFREIFARLLLPDGSPEKITSLVQLERRSAAAKTAKALWLAFHEVDVLEEAPRVRAPTLVLHCRGDAMVPFAEGRRLATLIPGAQFAGLEGRNHIVQEEDPCWQVLLREVREFLGDGEGRGPRADRFGLTRRERELLHLIAQGRSNTDISRALAIAPKTVRNHVSNIFCKLAVSHRAEAVVRAREAGYGNGSGLRS